MLENKLFTRNFTFLVLGQVSSLFGNAVLRLALSMYVLDITGSGVVFAGLLSMAVIPMILLSPFGGILADRANRRNIMVGLDFISGLTVLGTMLFFNEGNAIPVIGAVMIILSILSAFETPTVQASVPQMHTGDNLIKANAVVNQVAALSGLVAPLLGSVLYATLGLYYILPICGACFFLTALLECFIRLDYKKVKSNQNVFAMVRSDFAVSIRFIAKEERSVLKVLLLASVMNFLLVSVVLVGLPYIIRTILGLSAGYYGAAESLIGLSAIMGSLAVGLLITRLKIRKLYLILIGVGFLLFPIAAAFWFPEVILIKYVVLVGAVFIMQFLTMIFSVFALSIIQQKTPNELLGKVMAYVTTISLCVQPLGQMLYGYLFDQFSESLFWIFLITGLITCAIGVFSKRVFLELDS